MKRKIFLSVGILYKCLFFIAIICLILNKYVWSASYGIPSGTYRSCDENGYVFSTYSLYISNDKIKLNAASATEIIEKDNELFLNNYYKIEYDKKTRIITLSIDFGNEPIIMYFKNISFIETNWLILKEAFGLL